jgi:NADP-dependent 3-hydroxy acid dehydrogenase YdfG
MHVAITGASSGIGEALAREYLARGASVTLVARREERLREIARTAAGARRRIGEPAW